MRVSLKTIFSILFLCSLPAGAAGGVQSYKYANNDAEYTVVLPAAPTVKTVWANDTEIPYLENIPQNGQELGEVATFRRIDIQTNEIFDVQVTFLKTDHDFLSGLTQEKMLAAIEADFKGTSLENKKPDFSKTPNGLKWAALTGFSTDKDKRPLYNAEHYLTGQRSIMVIRIQYNLENKIFANDYKQLMDSITYRPL